MQSGAYLSLSQMLKLRLSLWYDIVQCTGWDGRGVYMGVYIKN